MKKKDGHPLMSYLATLAITGGLALSIRYWVIEPYQIPNSAMKPTLVAGDTIFVWKWPFRNKNQSTLVQAGEIVVFSFGLSEESGTQTNFIRRVIGLPGDRVELRAGHLLVNGRPLQRSEPKLPKVQNSFCSLEMLPSTSLTFTVCAENGSLADFPEQKVPENSYLVVGDWRSQGDPKKDRVWALVPKSSIVGKPWIVWLSVDYSQKTGYLPRIRWERIFQKIE